MDKNKFVFNLEWYAVLQEYPEEVRFEVYEAIMRYASSGTLPDLKPLAKMAFSFIRKEMDYNRERYENTVKKNSENGRKGGAPKGNRNASKSETNPIQPKTSETSETNPIQPKTSETSINDNDNDNDNVNDNELSSTTNGASAKAAVGAGAGFNADESFIEAFFSDRVAIEAFCMSSRISVEDFRRIAGEVLTEWRLRGVRHGKEEDARQHLINQSRIKINQNRHGTIPEDKYSKRRGADAGAVGPEDYTGTI